MTRVALVTGAAGGIGKATTELFASEGWSVWAVDARPAESLQAGISYRQVDISIAEEVDKLLGELSAEADGLDALINNAAIQVNQPLLAMQVEAWDRVMAANLRSLFLLSKAAHPLLKRAGNGAIVNVSSVHAFATSESVASYAASKGAALSLTRAMAMEFAKDNIRVNAMVPGAVDTRMLREGLDRGHLADGTVEEQLQQLARRIPLGRVAQAGEIAQGIYFLADSETSAYMTGQTLVVDGGVLARLSSE
jgi:NAD(P)-dependent dehydrogenase (short-subunit alcohol dehydrogenase family)